MAEPTPDTRTTEQRLLDDCRYHAGNAEVWAEQAFDSCQWPDSHTAVALAARANAAAASVTAAYAQLQALWREQDSKPVVTIEHGRASGMNH